MRRGPRSPCGQGGPGEGLGAQTGASDEGKARSRGARGAGALRAGVWSVLGGKGGKQGCGGRWGGRGVHWF